MVSLILLKLSLSDYQKYTKWHNIENDTIVDFT